MKSKLVSALLLSGATLASAAAFGESQALPPYVTEDAVVQAVGVPVVSKKTEQYAPGCMVTRYRFSADVLSMQLEFKCNGTNVAWFNTTDPGYEEKNKAAAIQATNAVMALTGGNGIEVEKAMQGTSFSGKTYSNGQKMSGSCVSSNCLLMFKPQ